MPTGNAIQGATGPGSPPVGTAGGGLAGTYPNPTIAPDSTAITPGFNPNDLGYLAWVFDIGVATSATAPTTGVINLIRVNIRQSISVTNVIITSATGGTTLTSGQNFAGLYAGQTLGAFTAGQLIGTTADQTTPWASTGVKVMALTGGPFTVPAATFVWVAVMSNTTGTTPNLFRSASTIAAGANAGFAAATARYATNGTGTTSLPASITPASNVLAGVMYWAALS